MTQDIGSALEVADLFVGYGAVPVVRAASLTLTAGRAVTLLGSNGAGKSTLLRGISGLLAPTHGRVLLDGQDITAVPAEARVAMGLSHVAEGRRIFPTLSVDDNLELGAFALKLSRPELERRRDECFGLFPILARKRGELSGALSGGQQQMLAIAQALIRSPKILMLDEPSLGLAPVIIDEVFAVLDKVRAQGRAILLVEQVVEQAMAFADYAYLMQSGRIVAHGVPAELQSRDVVRRAYLGEAIEQHAGAGTNAA